MNRKVEAFIRTKYHAAVFRERLKEIIRSLPEMTWQRSYEEAWRDICDATESLDEWVEVTARDDSGRLLAFAILADDDDAHVGPLLGVQWCWADPEAPCWAILRVHRKIHDVAREANYRVIAYTKRLDEGRYEINYVKVKEAHHGQESQEGVQEGHQVR